jgi:hypothetical protein
MENQVQEINLSPEEKKSERTIEVIQNEYTALAVKSGQLQYQIYTFQKDLDLLNSKMRDLNFEAAALKGKESGNE